MDLLGSGREADVYAIDADRVLRRYRRGDDATGEAELMAYLAGHGYPVPRVHSADGADMILDRIDGPTMTEAFAAGELDVDTGAAILVDLHEHLHRLPSRSGRDRILHRDLHPENVMLTAGGPVVIDWHNAAEGRPEVDVCLTAIIMAQVAADPGHPHAAAAGAFLGAFLSRAGGAGGSLGGAGGRPIAGLDEALDIRRADPALTAAEAAGLAATVIPLIHSALAGLTPPGLPPV